MTNKFKRIVAVLSVLGVVAGLLWTPFAVSGQASDQPVRDGTAFRWLTDQPARFDRLSGGMRTALLTKQGKTALASRPAKLSLNAPDASVANVLVNDPTADATAQDTQLEAALIVSGTTLVSAWFDSGSYDGVNDNITGFGRSTNGGTSFTDLGAAPNSLIGTFGEPVLAMDTQTGVIYLTTIGYTLVDQLPVFRSTTGGASFSAPVNGAPGLAGDVQDKPWIAVDNFAGAGQHNVYLAWRHFSGSTPDGIRLTKSTDAGVTFALTGTLVASSGAWNVQGPQVVVGPDHSVYVLWLDQSAGAGTPNIVKVAKSTNQGTTFASPLPVATLAVTETNGDLKLNGGFDTNAYPQAAVNPVSGNLYVVFNDNPAGADQANVYFTQSTNGGTTWSAPIKLNDDATTADQFHPALAVSPDGTKVAITWYDRRLDANNNLIDRYGVVGSIVGGTVTFGPNFRLTTTSFPPVVGVDPVIDPAYMGDYDQMAADNTYFYTAWGDNRDQSLAVPTRKNANVRFAKFPLSGPGAILQVVGDEIAFGSGNGNGYYDFNECNNVTLQLRNNGSSTATGLTATLVPNTAGVTVVQPHSAFPNVAPAATTSNTTYFKVATDPSILPGQQLNFTLIVTTTSDGTFNVPFSLTAGYRGTEQRFDNNTPLALPDNGSAVASPVVVAGLTAPVEHVRVSLYLTRPFGTNLSVSLSAPDGTIVELTADTTTGGDYGTGSADGARTTFDDEATTAIGSGTPPYVGTFKPKAPLAAFTGLPALSANGTWNLLVSDVSAPDPGGALNNWSLFIAPYESSDGGGVCVARPAIIGVSPSALSSVQAANVLMTKTLSIANTGPQNLNWDVDEVGSPSGTRFSQTDSPGTGSSVSQQFDAANAQFNAQGADDFVIPVGDRSWTIRTVVVSGTETAPVPAVNVFFYADNAGKPGVMLYSAYAIAPTADISGDLTINLASPAALPSGTYWLSVQANQSIAEQWAWRSRSSQSNSAAQWRNPGNGWGTGCFDWTDRQTCLPILPLQPDQLFQLKGNFGCLDASSIPWASASPLNGVTGAGGASPVNVLFNSTGLTSGVYTGNLCVNSNDPEQPAVSVPLTLTLSADVAITKTAPVSAQAGNTFTYTLNVGNAGPMVATSVVITDPLPAGLTFMAAPGCSNVSGVVTCSVPSLAAGASTTFNIGVRATEGGVYNNTAFVRATEFDANTANNQSAGSTTVTPAADLAVTKTDSPDPVYVGNRLNYTVTVSNNGPSTATSVVLTDTLPAGVTFASASAGCSGSGPIVCSLGTINSGGSVVVSIAVTPTVAGTINNSASAFGAQLDPNTANNTATASTTVLPQADVAVTKADNPDPVFVGTRLTYTLTVSNNGPSAATGVLLTDTLPAGVTFASASAGCSGSGPIVCSLGTINSGGSVIVTIAVTPTVAGSLVNSATARGAEADFNLANNTATASTTSQAQADVSVLKTAPAAVKINAVFTYTLVVGNAGPSPATGVVVSDTVPASFSIQNVTGTGCSLAGQLVTCNVGTLASGAQSTITIRVKAIALGAAVVNTGAVTATEPDPVPGNNSSSATVAVSNYKIMLPLMRR